MSTFVSTFVQQLNATSGLEIFAFLTGIINVYTAAKQWIICWTFAILSGILYCIFCYQHHFYLDACLQFFYIVMGIYGWISWRKPSINSSVITWGWKKNLINILFSTLLTFLLGWIFSTYTPQASPYLDAFILTFSLGATYMLTKKIHESWLYLIAIDTMSIFLFSSKHLYLSSILYVIFTILAIFGWLDWYKQFRNKDKIEVV